MEKHPIVATLKTALVVQAVVVVLLAVLGFALGVYNHADGLVCAVSAFAGAASAYLAQAFLAWRLLGVAGQDSNKFMSRFYSAEILKLVISAGLLTLSILAGALALYAFIGFAGTILSYWIVPVFVKKGD